MWRLSGAVEQAEIVGTLSDAIDALQLSVDGADAGQRSAHTRRTRTGRRRKKKKQRTRGEQEN